MVALLRPASSAWRRDRLARARSNSMTQFYGEIVASLVRRAALLYDYGVRPSGSVMVR